MGSIRLFLAFSVLVSHAVVLGIEVIPATVAVQSFFVISGFYMSLILNEKYEGSSLYVFYTNRFLRLFPTYLFILLLSFIALHAFDVGIFTRSEKLREVLTGDGFMALSYLWTNVAILGQDILFLLGISTADYSFHWDLAGNASVRAWWFTLVPQAWSLSMEFYFYLLAPFILRRGVRWVALLLIASLILRLSIIVLGGPEYDLFVRRFFPAELCLFLAGYFSYLLFKHVRNHNRRYLTGFSAWAALFCVFMLYDKINASYSLALLTVTITLVMPFIFNMAKDNRIDRFLGNISFPIYMVHFLVIECLAGYFEEYCLWILLPVVLVTALVVHFGIEVPIDYWRQRRVRLCRVSDNPAFGSKWCLTPSAVKATA
jgi:peptidoglycan/LPS O-acetylase OafA/YrhL